jgi:hypothetical protein
MENKCWRHGEVAFCEIKKLPAKLKQADTKTIVRGSHGNSHSFDNGKLYFKKDGEHIIGYFVAKNTTLFHAEHGKNGEAKLPDGVYEMRKQTEHTPAGLIPVVD